MNTGTIYEYITSLKEICDIIWMIKSYILIQEIALENIVWKMSFYSGFSVLNEYVWSEIDRSQAVIDEQTGKYSTSLVIWNLIWFSKLKRWGYGELADLHHPSSRTNDWPADPM